MKYTAKENNYLNIYVDYTIYIGLALSFIHLLWFKEFSKINWIELVIVYFILLLGTILKEVNKKYPKLERHLLNAYVFSCSVAVMAFLLIVPKQFLFLPVLILFFLLAMSSLFFKPTQFVTIGIGIGLLYIFTSALKVLIFERNLFTIRESLIYISVPFILTCAITFLVNEIFDKIIHHINILHEENNSLKNDYQDTKSLRNQIGKLHSLDPLTETLNRESSVDILEKFIELSIKYKFPLTISLIDISNLKEINRTHGVEVGDLVLKEFVELFKEKKKISDIVSRYTGDSFLLIFPRREKKECHELLLEIEKLEKIRFTHSSTSLDEIDLVDEYTEICEFLINKTLKKLTNNKLKSRLM